MICSKLLPFEPKNLKSARAKDAAAKDPHESGPGRGTATETGFQRIEIER